MTKLSRGLAALAAVGAMSLALAACAGPAADSTEPSGSAWDGSPIPSAVISLAAQTSSFDPTATVSATDRATSSLLSTSLFILDEEGNTVPGLAENVEYNEDFTAATVTLREAQFSDGSPITAEDVAATINRHKSVAGEPHRVDDEPHRHRDRHRRPDPRVHFPHPVPLVRRAGRSPGDLSGGGDGGCGELLHRTYRDVGSVHDQPTDGHRASSRWTPTRTSGEGRRPSST